MNKALGNIREILSMKEIKRQDRALVTYKLIWLNMQCMDTSFAQIEGMSGLFEQDYEQRVGSYLGSSLFLSNQSEILILMTNRVKIDLEQEQNEVLLGYLLKAIGQLASRALCDVVLHLLVKRYHQMES